MLTKTDFVQILTKSILQLGQEGMVRIYAGLVKTKTESDYYWQIFYEAGGDYTGLYEGDLNMDVCPHTKEELKEIELSITRLIDIYEGSEAVAEDMEYFLDYVAV